MSEIEAMASTVLSPTAGWILVLLFGLIWIGLGVFWGRRAKNLEGFMLAGRNVGLALGAATAMATWVTSNTVMLAPIYALQMGVWGMLAYATGSIGLLLFAPMAMRIRRLMPHGYTAGDFVRIRYGRPAWAVFLVISVLYAMSWMISMGAAAGLLLEALAGIPFIYGMTIILLVCVIYTLVGGLYAVIGTDYIQSLLILIGLVVVGAVVISKVELDAVYTHLSVQQPMLLSVLMPVALIAFFNNMFFGFGEIFHSNVWWSRAFAMRPDAAQPAYTLAALFWMPVPVAAGFVALCAGALGINVIEPNMVGPFVAGNVLGPIGAMVVFVIVFCSLGSSIDSLLAATSDLLTEDFYRKMLRPNATEGHLRRVAGFCIIALGIVTWVTCLVVPPNLANILFISGPLVGSAIWPIIGGLYWKSANGTGAFVAMLAGSACGLLSYYILGWFTGCVVGSAVSLVVMVVAMKLKPSDFDYALLDESEPETEAAS